MLIINGETQVQERKDIFERSYSIQNAHRKCIEIHFDPQEGLTYEFLAKTFVDGISIMRQETKIHIEQKIVNEEEIAKAEEEGLEPVEPEYEEVEVPEVLEYDLSEFCVAGDIIDKRDGSFVVYMGVKTEVEQLNEEMATILLDMGGIE